MSDPNVFIAMPLTHEEPASRIWVFGSLRCPDIELMLGSKASFRISSRYCASYAHHIT
jgi:hypothetical protein